MNRFRSQQSQKGDMMAVAIIVLVFLIVGTLGVVAWSNFISSQQDVSKPDMMPLDKSEEPALRADTLLYEGDAYSFEYPVKGWELTEEVGNAPGEVYPIIKTPDWAQSGMGLDAGADVSVYTRTATQTLDELREGLRTMDPQAVEVPNAEIGGVPALSFQMDYEGKRYLTIVIHEGLHYDIVYNYADDIEASTYVEAYDIVTSTFLFTNE